MNRKAVARMMDQAVLKPQSTDADIRRNAELCLQEGIGNLCVRPTDVAYAKSLLKNTPVTVSCVVGFPHGAARTETKALEARLAVEDGADELDLVMNIGKFLSGQFAFVQQDIQSVVAVARPKGVLVKVILETSLLSQEQIAHACKIAVDAGAEYVKTSTGFNGEGATVAAVKTMLETVQGRAKVKASGGIRDWNTALTFARMGVERLGVGAGPQILQGAPTDGTY